MPICYRFLLLVSYFVVTGCTASVDLATQDVAGKLWVKTLNVKEVPEGFYLRSDGSLLHLNVSDTSEGGWSVQEEKLMLADAAIFSGVLIDGELCLEPVSSDGDVVYCSVELEPLESGKKYVPAFLSESSAAYVQFDAEEGVVRGFGGVNNFRGEYSRKDLNSVDFGPVMSTRMAGPGLDDEFRLIQCLDHSDGMLALKGRLYLYQESKLLCSFSTEKQ